jgi:glycosyltransferase involved in cell wall biosynthesis
MRIALITPYAVFPGGVESINSILRGVFRDAGHSVDLITTDGYEPTWISKVRGKLIGLPHFTAVKFQKMAKTYDLVIANGEFGWGIKHPKTIVLFHGCYKGYRDYLRKQWSFSQYLNFTKLAFIQKKATKGKYVVAVSEFVRQILESDGITVRQVISNAVDTDLFRPDPLVKKTHDYLFVGSYNYYGKGFDVLESLADRRLAIDCVTNKQPNDKLGWIPNTANEHMPEIYNRYRLLIFPSRFEGMPMAPLEAMACGLPIVMSNVGLGPELKQEIPEFVTEGHDTEEYLQKIRNIKANYDEFSRRARIYIEQHHAFDKYKKRWNELIERIAHA